jgi:4-hydroxy-3-polyprenylbenzoate decarboxylase
MLHIVVGITGASGIIYAWRFLEVLKEREIDVSIIITNQARDIIDLELSKKPEDILSMAKHHYDIDDFSSPLASGSYKFDAMVIVPCSMASVGAIASGNSRNLLLRAADICLKEGRPLIIYD